MALKSDKTVPIHAVAGGVGGFAVQYAKHLAATVYATASDRNRDYVRDLGANELGGRFAYVAQPSDEFAPPDSVTVIRRGWISAFNWRYALVSEPVPPTPRSRIDRPELRPQGEPPWHTISSSAMAPSSMDRACRVIAAISAWSPIGSRPSET